MSKEDIFHYVYEPLHHPHREPFTVDLKKILPRLLAQLLLEYADFTQAPNSEMIGLTVHGVESGKFRVEEIHFPSKSDRSRILYNSQIMIENIPPDAYEYVVNGKSAIEWVMPHYAINTHKYSGIRNDPNDWAEEVGNPRDILDLLLSASRLSVEIVYVVKGLPEVGY
jgi:predicted helicase